MFGRIQDQAKLFASVNGQNYDTGKNNPACSDYKSIILSEAVNKCKICLDSKMDTRLDPCGHLFTCGSCSSMLRVCPICRKPIQKWRKQVTGKKEHNCYHCNVCTVVFVFVYQFICLHYLFDFCMIFVFLVFLIVSKLLFFLL